MPTYRGPLPVCFNGFEGAVSAPCGRVANAPFFGLPELGFRWCLAFSDPLPTSFIFAFVQVRLPHVFCLPTCPPTAVLYLSVLTVSKVQFQHRVEGLRTHRFLACLSSDLGGVWLFRIRFRRASFLPLSRLGCVTVFDHLLRPFTPLRGFHRCPFGSVWKGCERAVFGLPELVFTWCLVFRIRCRRASFSLRSLGPSWYFFHHGFAVPTVSFGGGSLRSWPLII